MAIWMNPCASKAAALQVRLDIAAGDKLCWSLLAGSTVFSGSQPKRRKTEAPKEPPPAAEFDPEQPWELQTRQPWADKEVAPAILNDEQKAYLEQVGSADMPRISAFTHKSFQAL